MSDGFFDNVAGHSPDSSTVTAFDSCNSSISGSYDHFPSNVASRALCYPQFSGAELTVPDMAELEWLSNLVEDSFSAEDELKTLHLLSGNPVATKPQTPESSSSLETPHNAPFFHPETPLPAKARSKHSRAAPGDWSTRLLHVITPTTTTAQPKPVQPKTSSVKKRESANSDSLGPKCLHCAAEKTAQWRTGPMGQKTLCS